MIYIYVHILREMFFIDFYNKKLHFLPYCHELHTPLMPQSFEAENGSFLSAMLLVDSNQFLLYFCSKLNHGKNLAI